jgi:hypothetical protein
MVSINPLTAATVVIATAATDAVISYTENWVYVAFAAAGSWIGAFASISFLHRPPGGPPVGAGLE